MNHNFCVFIISHGRPDNVLTFKTIRKQGYTGKVFIVCDNEDKTVQQYKKGFGESSVFVFDKLSYARKVDSCDNFQNRRTTTHARNACFDIAASLNVESFLVLDDDYTEFRYTFNSKSEFVRIKIRDLNSVFNHFCEMMNCDTRLNSICMMQTGDLVGGAESVDKWASNPPFPFKRRKAMNSFFCKTNRRFWFFSRLNEDVNTYLRLGNVGGLFLTIPDTYLQQKATQKTAGGMSEAYLASGTYVKTFYSVINFPSFVVATVTPGMNRLHHKVSWNNAIPKILDDSYRKS